MHPTPDDHVRHIRRKLSKKSSTSKFSRRSSPRSKPQKRGTSTPLSISIFVPHSTLLSTRAPSVAPCAQRFPFDLTLTGHTFVNRVHAHAAAALINFCEGVERDTLIPYLDSIVERLLKLLNPAASDASKQPKRYVQEQVITTLAMVADASEATFAKVRGCRSCWIRSGRGSGG